RPPATVDVVLVAPRMIGVNLRRSFEAGRGVPAYVAVAQDASGRARDLALAWAKGIGATRAGVIETTFAQETELDLFAEQGVWRGGSLFTLRSSRSSWGGGGGGAFPPGGGGGELSGGGEPAELSRQRAPVGLAPQIPLLPQASQYGTLSRGPSMLPEDARDRL